MKKTWHARWGVFGNEVRVVVKVAIVQNVDRLKIRCGCRRGAIVAGAEALVCTCGSV